LRRNSLVSELDSTSAIFRESIGNDEVEKAVNPGEAQGQRITGWRQKLDSARSEDNFG
jgi:hypothetical protein